MDLIDSWGRHLRATRRSASTVRSYCSDARQLLDSVGDLAVGDITALHVEQLLRADVARGLAPATVTRRYRSLQQFGRWLERRGHIDENLFISVELPCLESDPHGVLSARELAALLGVCRPRDPNGRDGAVDNFADHRDTAIVVLLVTTGMTASELIGLATDDVDVDAATIHVTGRNRRQRSVHILRSSTETLDGYLRIRHAHRFAMSSSSLWLGEKGPLTYAGLRQMLARRSDAAGVRRSTPHLFRRTFASDALRHGMSAERLMAAGGWETDQMPKRYGETAGSRA